MIKSTTKSLFLRPRPWFFTATHCDCKKEEFERLVPNKMNFVGMIYAKDVLQNKGVKHTEISPYKVKVELLYIKNNKDNSEFQTNTEL